VYAIIITFGNMLYKLSLKIWGYDVQIIFIVEFKYYFQQYS